MANPFVAEIRIFPFNFAPTGWAFCDGQLLPISQNTALFSLVGTFYGGDGRTTFALPNMQGSAPMHAGAGSQGPGLSSHSTGEAGGSDTVTLLQTHMPAHTHAQNAFNSPPPANAGSPAPTLALARSSGGSVYTGAANLVTMSASGVTTAGGDQPHNNLMPYLTLNFCIALQGVFPPRS